MALAILVLELVHMVSLYANGAAIFAGILLFVLVLVTLIQFLIGITRLAREQKAITMAPFAIALLSTFMTGYVLIFAGPKKLPYVNKHLVQCRSEAIDHLKSNGLPDGWLSLNFVLPEEHHCASQQGKITIAKSEQGFIVMFYDTKRHFGDYEYKGVVYIEDGTTAPLCEPGSKLFHCNDFNKLIEKTAAGEGNWHDVYFAD